MSPNRDDPQRTVRLDEAPSGRGWCIAFVDAATGPGDNLALTRGLEQLFRRPELAVRGLPSHQARGLLTRVAEHFTTSPAARSAHAPTHLRDGHFSIELVDGDPAEWTDIVDGERAGAVVEIIWTNDLSEIAHPADAA